jgi:putative (di)nucleoside polyphosphate hydrolase
MLPYRKCVAIFLIKNSRIFVGKRIDVKDAWQLPQGGVEEGESYLDAAKRELFEETNVSSIEFLGSSSLYIYDFPMDIVEILIKKRGQLRYAGQEIIFLAFKFIGEEKEIDLQKNTPREFLDWKWTSEKELLDNIIYFKKTPYRKAITEFKELDIL